MKKSKIFGIIIAILLMMSTLFACDLFGSSSSNNNTPGTSSGGSKQQVFHVTLKEDIDGISSKDFISNGMLVKPNKTPTKVGYTFVRWCSDSACQNELVFNTKITGDVEIYAQWAEQTFTVTFVDKVNGNSTLTVPYRNRIAPKDALGAGYTFLGWYTDEKCTTLYDKTTNVTKDFSLYAGWEEIQYPITYYANGGSVTTGAPQTYTRFSDVALPSCTKEGYHFDGWYTSSTFDGEKVTQIVKGETAESKAFYAKFLCTDTKVEAIVKSVVISGQVITIPTSYLATTIDLEDYLAFPDGSTYTIAKDLSGVSSITLLQNDTEENVEHTYSLTIRPEYGESVIYQVKINQYTSSTVTVEYYSGASKIDSEPVFGGSKATVPDDPTPDAGYTFEYWYLEGETGQFSFDTVLGDEAVVRLHAKYSAIEYTIAYYVGYGKNDVRNVTSYTVEDAVTLYNPTCSNPEYTFEGWYTENTYTNKVSGFTAGTVNNKTLYACYSLKSLRVKDYSEATTIPLSELNDYFIYLTYNRIENVAIKVSGGQVGEDITSYITDANSIKMPGADNRTINYTRYSNGGSYYIALADENGVWDLNECSITLSYRSFATKDTEQEPITQIGTTTHYSTTGKTNTDLAINHIKNTLIVSDTEQLVYALEYGYRPVPVSNSSAERVYNEMISIVNQIIEDGMTDYEKALAIYDYLIDSISYDYYIFNLVLDGTLNNTDQDKTNDSTDYKCFYLEGAIEKKIAVCDGISKAFMALCRLEGLRAVQVEGTSIENGTGHAWNKIYLAVGEDAPAWYIVDATSGNMTLYSKEKDPITGEDVIVTSEIFSYEHFLITSTNMSTRYQESTDSEFPAVADGAFNYYEYQTYEYNEEEYNYYIDSDEKMNVFFKTLFALAPNTGTQVCLGCQFAEGYSYLTQDNYIKSATMEGIEFNDYSFGARAEEGNPVIIFFASRKAE